MNDTPPANMIELSIPRPNIPTRNIIDAIDYAKSFGKLDAVSAEIASAEREELRQQKKLIEAQFKAVKQPLVQAGRALDALFSPYFNQCEEGIRLYDRLLADYSDAEKARQQEAQIRARESQRLEQERLAHEAAKREKQAQVEAEKLRAQALEAATSGNQNAASELERRADHAEIAGQQDVQQMIEQLQLTAPAPVEKANLPSGITSRQSWSDVEVHDLAELVCACAEGKQPMRYLLPNMTVLRQSAAALKEEFNVPGVKVYPRTIIAAKARK